LEPKVASGAQFDLFLRFVQVNSHYNFVNSVLHATIANIAHLDPCAAAQPSDVVMDHALYSQRYSERLFLLKLLGQLVGTLIFKTLTAETTQALAETDRTRHINSVRYPIDVIQILTEAYRHQSLV